jgi:hypothetical protein
MGLCHLGDLRLRLFFWGAGCDWRAKGKGERKAEGFRMEASVTDDILTDRIRYRSSRVHHPNQRKGRMSLFEVAESLSIGLSGLQT